MAKKEYVPIVNRCNFWIGVSLGLMVIIVIVSDYGANKERALDLCKDGLRLCETDKEVKTYLTNYYEKMADFCFNECEKDCGECVRSLENCRIVHRNCLNELYDLKKQLPNYPLNIIRECPYDCGKDSYCSPIYREGIIVRFTCQNNNFLGG